MSTIVTRSGKGSPLTNTELDANFTNLNTDKIQSGNTVASLTITACVVSNDLTVDTSTLKVDSTNNRVGVLNATPDVSLDAGSATDAVHIPTGTTAQRPGSPAAGYFRYNSSTGGFEGYTTEWGDIGGGGANLTTNNYTGDGSTTAFTLSLDPSVEQNTFIYIDGVYQQKNTYTTSGTTLTFSAAPPSSASIEVMSMTAINSIVGTVSDNAITTAKIADSTGASDGVTTAKLATSAVTTAKIANDAVNQDKIDDDAVGTDQLAGSLTVDIDGGAIDGTTIGANAAAAGTFTTVTDGDGAVRAIPQSGTAKTANYVLVAGDVGNFIELGANGEIEIPNSVFSAGDAVSVFNNTASSATITCTIATAYKAGTDADQATVTLKTRGIATILFISGTVCAISGNLT